MKARRIIIVAVVLAILLTSGVVILGPGRVLRVGQRRLERGWLWLTGRLIDVGGHRLHIESRGKGSPTVIMDAGLCQPQSTWGTVPGEVAKFTRVFTYDRAGLGYSDAGPTPRTSQQIVDELHTLLVKSGISGPYVLVGHSFGGFNVRLYATRYPEDVVGMVLVDASHEDQSTRFAALKPPQEREAYLQQERGGNYEKVDCLTSSAQVRAAGPLPSVPLIVLEAQESTQMSDDPFAQASHEMQTELARLVPDGRHIVVEGSGHFIQLDRPESVIDAIRTVVEEARRLSMSGTALENR